MNESGQSSVELVALLPMIAAVALCAGQVLAAGAAREAAGSAAQAAAMAQLQGGDPHSAARSAAPDWAQGRLKLVLEGRQAQVTVAPRVLMPGLATLLVARVTADAGPKR